MFDSAVGVFAAALLGVDSLAMIALSRRLVEGESLEMLGGIGDYLW
jgi:hypothetical protein